MSGSPGVELPHCGKLDGFLDVDAFPPVNFTKVANVKPLFRIHRRVVRDCEAPAEWLTFIWLGHKNAWHFAAIRVRAPRVRIRKGGDGH